CPALAADERHEEYERGKAADQQQLAHRIGGDQPLAQSVVEREGEAPHEHQRDSRGERGFRGLEAAMNRLQGHFARTVIEALWMLYDNSRAPAAKEPAA